MENVGCQVSDLIQSFLKAELYESEKDLHLDFNFHLMLLFAS